MKKWNINNILQNDDTNFDYSLALTLSDGTTTTIYNDQTFKDILLYKYTSFCISNPTYFDSITNQLVDTVVDLNDAIGLFHAIYTIWKNSRLPAFANLYEALRADYNPIWNVDGVTGIITEDTHTGTDTFAKTGSDTSNLSGKDTLASTGTDSNAHTGTITDSHTVTDDTTTKTGNETNVKTGNETNTGSGTDTNTTGVTTFDDQAHWINKEQTGTAYGKTDTHTYNQLTDTHTFNSVQDSHTYSGSDTRTFLNTDALTHGKTDTTTFGKQDKVTYNSTNTNTKNLADKHLEMNIRQGNIGLTSTQNLINQSIDLASRDNIIDFIISDFIHNYCIL